MPTIGHTFISFNLLIHRIVNDVHCVSNILEHAPVGHKQVAVLVTFREAGRDLTAEKERWIHWLIWSSSRRWSGEEQSDVWVHSLCVSGASGEEVHKAGVEISLCRVHGNISYMNLHTRLRFLFLSICNSQESGVAEITDLHRKY